MKRNPYLQALFAIALIGGVLGAVINRFSAYAFEQSTLGDALSGSFGPDSPSEGTKGALAAEAFGAFLFQVGVAALFIALFLGGIQWALVALHAREEPTPPTP